MVCSEPATADIFECLWCEGRQHASCSKLSTDECNAIANISTPNIVFFCSSCIQVVPVALRHYDNQVLVESRITAVETSVIEIQCSERKLHESVKSVESQIESFQKSIKSLLNEHTTQLSKVSTSVNAVPPESAEQIAVSLLSEQKEKEKRQLNIMIHKLEESTADDGQSRKQDDIKKCVSLFQNYLGAKVAITNAFRLGKKSNRPRLLKLTLSSMEEKALILRNKSKLRSTSHPEDVRNVFITPDFTPIEQKRNKALREQLINMNKTENIYMIKNGRIVRRQT